LAAISAALLLLTAALAARGIWRWDVFMFNAGPRALFVGSDGGTIAVGIHSVPAGFPPFDWSSEGEYAPSWSWWTWRWIGMPTGGELVMPVWIAALLPMAGLWWSWRRRRAPAAFPIEPAATSAT
jgi:hypothetical protein